ncbi:alpha/beta hydrolase [Amycolatopsis samaneae]|uniref:Alpha/beta hydrolase n=1 Tax=Amycolatopsis samaneae TaxID=664691 RepID=A0ABW5GWR5_9PSEU
MSDITIKPVTVKTPYWDIAANLLLPPDFDDSKTYPAVVSAHPIGSCKEQTAGNVYGPALAKEGFVVIAFDASFQGESGGEPRWTEDPARRVADFSYVVDHLVTLGYVDADRIGVLGICGGGGYATNATMLERRFKALGAVVPVNYGRLMQEGFSQYDAIALLEQVAEQRTKEARGGDVQVNELLPPSPAAAQEAGATDRDVVEATEYYKTDRGGKPNGVARMNFGTLNQALNWDAFLRAETMLTQPALIVVGDQPGAFGSYRDGMELYGRIASSKDRQLVVAEGYSHYDLYDRPEPVKIALDALIPFYRKHLGQDA